jgi:hypothetical protein
LFPSLLIPYFWILAGFTFLTIMGMIAVRELRVRPRTLRNSRGPGAAVPTEGA